MQKINFYRFGFTVALLTSAITTITFAIAVMTPPLSGPFCTTGCFEYPYTDITGRFPRDYYWMYPAMLVFLMYLILMSCIHEYAATEKKLFSRLGLAVAIMSAGILITNYFIQVSVIQPSLLRGETDGIALLTQYNPHGRNRVSAHVHIFPYHCPCIFRSGDIERYPDHIPDDLCPCIIISDPGRNKTWIEPGVYI